MSDAILKTIPTLQSLALAGHTYKLVKKKKKKASDFIETGATTMIGAAMIKEQSKFLEGF